MQQYYLYRPVDPLSVLKWRYEKSGAGGVGWRGAGSGAAAGVTGCAGVLVVAEGGWRNPRLRAAYQVVVGVGYR
jgi:hypothetical protein